MTGQEGWLQPGRVGLKIRKGFLPISRVRPWANLYRKTGMAVANTFRRERRKKKVEFDTKHCHFFFLPFSARKENEG